MIKLTLSIFTITLAFNASASSKPLFELGLAGALVNVPDYPASDETTTHTIIVPTFIYRGSFIRNDRRGTRAMFFKNDYVDIDISLGASLPSNSKDNKTREGMKDLHFMFEVGPRLSYMLLYGQTHILELELPIRYVLSTNTQHTQHRGYRFQPQIDYRRKFHNKFSFGVSFKLNYATEKLNDYFYEVDPNDVTSDRQRFNAKGGFLGRDTSASMIYRDNSFLLVLGYRVSHYQGSANEKSPLYKISENNSVFLAFNYFFYQSKQTGEMIKDLN